MESAEAHELPNSGYTYESEIWLNDTEVGEQRLGLVVLDRGVYDDIVTRYPIYGRGYAVLVAGLEGVEDTKDFSRVATSGGGVREDQTDGLLGIDDEYLERGSEVSACLKCAMSTGVYQPI